MELHNGNDRVDNHHVAAETSAILYVKDPQRNKIEKEVNSAPP